MTAFQRERAPALQEQLSAAVSAQHAALGKLAAHRACVSDLHKEIDERRSRLPTIAADGPKFREELAFISVEEDRLRAFETVLVPEAEAAAVAAGHTVDKARRALATGRAYDALEQMIAADVVLVERFRDLEVALAESQQVREQIRSLVIDPLAQVREDALAISALYRAVPSSVWRFFRTESFANFNPHLRPSERYRPDIAAFHRARLGLSDAVVAEAEC